MRFSYIYINFINKILIYNQLQIEASLLKYGSDIYIISNKYINFFDKYSIILSSLIIANRHKQWQTHRTYGHCHANYHLDKNYAAAVSMSILLFKNVH